MAFQIRKAGVEDIPKVMLFFNSYTAPPKSAIFFHWWNQIPSVTFCALDNNRIVGLFVVLKRRLVNGLTCGVLMGLIVDSDWRGSGLFRDLGNETMNYFKDIDIFCCLTNSIGKRALEKNFDFRTIDDIETMILAGHAAAERHDSFCVPIKPDTGFASAYVRRKGDMVMFLADQEFRRWRYALHPRFTYHMVRKDSGEFVIFSQYLDPEKGVRYGDIVDFETASLDEDCLINLLDTASSNLAKDVDRISIQAIPSSPLHGIVQKMGFVESGCRHHFCVKVKVKRHKHLYDPSKWLIKWGDYLR